MMYPYNWFTKPSVDMILYTVTCIATAGSRDASRYKSRIRALPGNLNLVRTYANCVPTITYTSNTIIITIKELRKALPMFAVVKAFTKLSRLRKLPGSVITLVCWYSSVVLKAVITQEIIGTTAQREKNMRDVYSKIGRASCRERV